MPGIQPVQLLDTSDNIQGSTTTPFNVALIFNGTQLGTNFNPLITAPLDGQKRTYSAAINALVAGTAPTDIFTISNSAQTSNIRVTRLEIAFTQTTGGDIDVFLIKRSALNTGGTSTAPTAVRHDTQDAVAAATINAYTVNPASLGAAIGTMRVYKLFGAATTALTDRVIEDTGNRPGARCIVLRGLEVLAVNLNGITTPAGSSFDISVEWTEE